MDVLQVIRKNPSQTTEVDLKEEIYCLLYAEFFEHPPFQNLP